MQIWNVRLCFVPVKGLRSDADFIVQATDSTSAIAQAHKFSGLRPLRVTPVAYVLNPNEFGVLAVRWSHMAK